MVLPTGTQNAMGYMTPGMGMMLTFDDLVLMSGGAVTGSFPMYQVHETITVMPSDTLMVNGGLDIMMDPGMNIAIEILGTMDGNMGFGTRFHSMGFGTWRGIWVHDSGALQGNGFQIMDAQDAIYIDHTLGFGMVQIMGCMIDQSVNSGITMLGTMGGPMVQGNIVTGCPVGFRLESTTAQCQNNDISNCGIGFLIGGFLGPGIFGNTIHDNTHNAIYIEGPSTWINSNTIRDNGGDAIVVINATAGISDNNIFAWNATAWSNENGRNGIRINGTVEWGQNYISNNRIFGGNGDGIGDGGHAIYIEDFVGNPMNQPNIENTVIENNFIIQGGNGGNNFDDWSIAGDGGHGIYCPRLSDDGNWSADNHALIIRGNTLIAGGMGGMDNAPMFGTAGNGGHGLCVRDDNNAGSMLSTGNLLVVGGGGGGRMSPGLCGDGGHGLCTEDCDSGVRVDIRNHADVVGGMGGAGPTGMGQGGASLRLVR
ncbi:MAG: hypothetical protein PHU53_04885, partial [Thermoplasmata archaeon]|nr:hypothetical protein [Thermoplasmata archaeon]